MTKLKKLLVLPVVLLFSYSPVHGEETKLFSEAYSLMQKSLFEEALVKLRESLKESPNHAPTNSSLALCLEKLKQYDEAVEVWRRYERISGGTGGRIQQHIMLIGKMKEILPELTKGTPTPVLGTISEILKDPYPESIIKLDCATYLAHYYYMKGKYDESYSLYSQAIAQYRNYFVDEEALYEYAHLLSENKKDYVSAAKIYKDILIRPKGRKTDATDLLAECYKSQAEVYEKEGKEKEARLMYERILIETPSSKYAEVAKGKVGDIVGAVENRKDAADLYFADGEYSKALEYYKKVIEGAKDEETVSYARFQVGKTLATMRNYSEAIRTYHAIVRETPDSSYADDALVSAGCLLGGVMNKPEQAIKELTLVIKKYPEGDMLDDATYYIGYIYLRRLNNPKQAYKIFSGLIEKYPSSPWAKWAKEKMEEIKRGR